MLIPMAICMFGWAEGEEEILYFGKVLAAAGFLFLLCPTISAIFRRLHDTSRSGWWMLLNLIPVIGQLFLLILLMMPGRSEVNEYGIPA